MIESCNFQPAIQFECTKQRPVKLFSLWLPLTIYRSMQLWDE